MVAASAETLLSAKWNPAGVQEVPKIFPARRGIETFQAWKAYTLHILQINYRTDFCIATRYGTINHQLGLLGTVLVLEKNK